MSQFIKQRVNSLAPWLILIASVVVYSAGRWILPTLWSDHLLMSSLLEGFTTISRFVAHGLFLSAIAVFLANHFKKKKRQTFFDNQTSIRSVHALTWEEFEHYCAELFVRRGYKVVENAKKGADGGIDLRLQDAHENVIVQCKHYKSTKVGAPVVRDLLGVVTSENANRGVVITSGQFTNSARQFAESNNIELIDGDALAASLGDQQETKLSHAGALCPKCSADMVKRLAKSGPNKGKYFYGCSRFPKCRGTIAAGSK